MKRSEIKVGTVFVETYHNGQHTNVYKVSHLLSKREIKVVLCSASNKEIYVVSYERLCSEDPGYPVYRVATDIEIALYAPEELCE